MNGPARLTKLKTLAFHFAFTLPRTYVMIFLQPNSP
jgi:hypothetical protein